MELKGFPTILDVDKAILDTQEEKRAAVKLILDKVAAEVAECRKQYDRDIARLRTLRKCIL